MRWPWLGRRLRRIVPNLRRVGIEVDFDRGTGKTRKRMIRLFLANNQPSESSELDVCDPMVGVIADVSDISDNRMDGDTGSE